MDVVAEKRENGRERVLYFDLLNIISCFGVVALHCSNTVFEYRLNHTWIFALIVQVSFYWTVPIFIMLSGATLLNYREKYTTKVFFKRRVLRVVLPFLLWSTVFLIWKLNSGELIWENWKTTLSWYLGNGIESIYWFFYPLFGMYLMIPVLSILANQRYKKLFYYIFIIAAVYSCVLVYFPEHFQIYYNTTLFSPLANGFLGYIVLGWILSREELSKKLRRVIYGIGILSFIVMFTVTVYKSYRTGTFDYTFFDATGCTAYGMAAAIFVWFRYRDWSWLDKKRIRRAIRAVSGASFGIYLIQMRFIAPLIWETPENNGIRWMTAGALGIYLICLAIVLLVKKIPILNKVFP